MVTPVTTLSQTLADVKKDTVYSARFIGPSTPNISRITVNSALSKYNDKVDNFRVAVTRDTEELSLTVKSTATLQFKLLDSRGKVVADSAAKDGELKTAYDRLTTGKYAASEGNYYVQVSRPKGTDKTAAIEYYFQITNGKKFTTDYDTRETPPPRDARTVDARTQAASSVASQLSATVSTPILSSNNIFSKFRSIDSSIIQVTA